MYGIIILLRIMWNFDCSATIFCIIFKIASTQWLRFFFWPCEQKFFPPSKKNFYLWKNKLIFYRNFFKTKSTLSVLLFTKITWTKTLFLWWNQIVYFCISFISWILNYLSSSCMKMCYYHSASHCEALRYYSKLTVKLQHESLISRNFQKWILMPISRIFKYVLIISLLSN